MRNGPPKLKSIVNDIYLLRESDRTPYPDRVKINLEPAEDSPDTANWIRIKSIGSFEPTRFMGMLTIYYNLTTKQVYIDLEGTYYDELIPNIYGTGIKGMIIRLLVKLTDPFTTWSIYAENRSKVGIASLIIDQDSYHVASFNEYEEIRNPILKRLYHKYIENALIAKL